MGISAILSYVHLRNLMHGCLGTPALRMLTYADVCWRMLTYVGVCWRMLTNADVR